MLLQKYKNCYNIKTRKRLSMFLRKHSSEGWLGLTKHMPNFGTEGK